MRMPNAENEELRQKILNLLKQEAMPLSQPEIAKRLELGQAKVWQMLNRLIATNSVMAISKSQSPELFKADGKKAVAYLFTTKVVE
ncbi:MAG: winged helix-turn-helix domain-containing protein [Candidatus Blackburnbacteria bacterium]|nr:winged helix-turn-helix domain-containing protein [Candidatus Blackburnbacteria bacterium]